MSIVYCIAGNIKFGEMALIWYWQNQNFEHGPYLNVIIIYGYIYLRFCFFLRVATKFCDLCVEMVQDQQILMLHA